MLRIQKRKTLSAKLRLLHQHPFGRSSGLPPCHYPFPSGKENPHHEAAASPTTTQTRLRRILFLRPSSHDVYLRDRMGWNQVRLEQRHDHWALRRLRCYIPRLCRVGTLCGCWAMIPLSIIRRRVIWSSCLYMLFFIGSALTAIFYLPLYFQTVRHASLTMSGVDLLPSIIATSLFSIVAGGLSMLPYPSRITTRR
jgi:hypothetical protein